MTRVWTHLGVGETAADRKLKEKRTDELFVQKIKNFFLLSTTACESMERNQTI